MEWKENAKIQIERKRNVNESDHKLYDILVDQFFTAIHPKLEGKKGHKQVEAYQYGITLLAIIKKIMCGVEEYPQNTMAIVMTDKKLHTFWQNTNVANNDYRIRFYSYITALEGYADKITVPLALVGGKIIELYPSFRNQKNALLNQREAEIEAAKEKYLACMLLVGTNYEKFG